MNDTSQNERDERMVRLMAVVGFVVLICLLAWLAVQVVRFIPTAFSSLANIFEANQRDYGDRVHEDAPNVVVENDEQWDDEGEDLIVTGSDNKPQVSVSEPKATSTPITTVPEVSSPVVSKPATPAPVQYKTVVTHKTPVSDPQGYADLAMSFSAVGYTNASGRFIPMSELSDRDLGAVQFVVKNIGTKTSGEWHFEIELPNNASMKSKVQLPLKPQESATLTVVFGVADRGNYEIRASVFGGNDVNTSNNSFRARTSIR